MLSLELVMAETAQARTRTEKGRARWQLRILSPELPSQAQSEAIIEPDSKPDDVRREPMALEGNGLHVALTKRRDAASGEHLALD